jgi:hypothetical protein
LFGRAIGFDDLPGDCGVSGVPEKVTRWPMGDAPSNEQILRASLPLVMIHQSIRD